MSHIFHHRLFIGLAAAAIMAAAALAACPVCAQTPAEQQPPAKVWTNDDVRALGTVPLSFESESVAAARTGSTPAVKAPGALPPKQRDPAWYRVQLSTLRAQAAEIEARERQIRAELDSRRGGTQGLNLAEDAEGITPQSSLDILDRRRAAILKKIDALEDQAQRNGISPGELRREPTAADYRVSGYMQYALETAPADHPPRTEQDWRARFADLRAKLARAQQEQDVLQRKLGRAVLQYYPDPNKTLKESITFREENKLRARIAEKKAEVAALQQQISDLEDALRRAGAPPGWAR